MLFNRSKKSEEISQAAADAMIMDMINRTQATIQFEPDGTIITANQNFLDALGYQLDEIVGQHHSMFVYESYAAKPEYEEFWKSLAAGEANASQFPRVRKNGDVIWIQATYAPVFDADGKVVKVIKLATDVTVRRKGLQAVSAGLKALREGDLSHRVEVSEIPDIGDLGRNFNSSVEKLESTIEIVSSVSETVLNTVNDLNQSSGDLASRTEGQAATLEETAAAIEELTVTVRSSAGGAREVENIVRDEQEKATESGKVVSNAIGAMSEIESSSDKIANIISVIDDIAFQTNLLALNAGVEAARAGEAGRGFAVVASEVRALAQRSSHAAGEIKQLIGDSNRHVANGVKLVGQAGETLHQIIESVGSISGHVSGIALGAEEQSTTLGEVNTGMTELDKVTQQNAAMVQQSKYATEALMNEAKRLGEQVGTFKTAGRPIAPIVQMSDHQRSSEEPAEAPPAPTAHGDMDAAVGWDDF